MAAGEYVIGEGVRVILEETTYRYHTYRADDEEGFISFRVQADEEGCFQAVASMLDWLGERQEAFLAQRSDARPAPENDAP